MKIFQLLLLVLIISSCKTLSDLNEVKDLFTTDEKKILNSEDQDFIKNKFSESKVIMIPQDKSYLIDEIIRDLPSDTLNLSNLFIQTLKEVNRSVMNTM